MIDIEQLEQDVFDPYESDFEYALRRMKELGLLKEDESGCLTHPETEND